MISVHVKSWRFSLMQDSMAATSGSPLSTFQIGAPFKPSMTLSRFGLPASYLLVPAGTYVVFFQQKKFAKDGALYREDSPG